MKNLFANPVYQEPLLTHWPTPLSLKDLKECFSIDSIFGANKKKAIKEVNPKDAQNSQQKSRNILSSFLNLFFTSP